MHGKFTPIEHKYDPIDNIFQVLDIRLMYYTTDSIRF